MKYKYIFNVISNSMLRFSDLAKIGNSNIVPRRLRKTGHEAAQRYRKRR